MTPKLLRTNPHNLHNRRSSNKPFFFDEVREQIQLHPDKDNKRYECYPIGTQLPKLHTKSSIDNAATKARNFYFQNKPLAAFLIMGLIALLLRWSGFVENKVYNDHYSTNFIRKYFHFHAIVIR